jgi:Ca-activated chloride channel homolog
VARLTKFVCTTALLILLTPLLVPRSEAQSGTSSADRNGKQQTKEAPQAKDRIRVHVNEVIVPVTVTDKRGELVLDLSKSDFHVFDGGAEQTIDRFDLAGDPLAVALVIETSSHVQVMAPVIRGMGIVFTETVMALSGEAAVITYDSTVDVRQPFTQDHDAIEKAIAGLQFQDPERKLYDGMAKAVALLQTQPPPYRRIMLVIGESQDYSSDAKLREVVENAHLADITIYAIGPSSTTADLRFAPGEIAPMKVSKHAPTVTVAPPDADLAGHSRLDLLTPTVWLLMRGTNEIKNHQLEVAAASTGGIHYRALRDETIRTALDRIGGELHAQYVLSYVPSIDPPLGFNEIKVTVSRPNLALRARPGYYVSATQ